MVSCTWRYYVDASDWIGLDFSYHRPKRGVVTSKHPHCPEAKIKLLFSSLRDRGPQKLFRYCTSSLELEWCLQIDERGGS